jgi:hypothetical protein
MLQLTGLTRAQKAMCDIIWSMDTQEQILAWFNTLPSGQAHQAHVLMKLMILEQLDQEDLGEMAEANQVIQQIKGQL